MNNKQNKPTIKNSFLGAIKNFIEIVPMILAVTLSIGLFQIYITPDMLSHLFGYSNFSDTLIGTLSGAISSGNAAISYVVAQGLQNEGVSVYATVSFILAWVTLGFVQLPAEVSIFGLRFTVVKNLLALISTILVTYLTIVTVGFIVWK